MSTEEPTEPLPPAPTTLGDGRYRLGDRLGAGGMGVVVQATDEVLHREVAVKLLADNLAADADARERFVREARSAAQVSDPHVVQVFDVGEERGRPYLIMELVTGPSLADTLARQGPLPPGELADVATDALVGVGRAHDAGVLHRDLKPGNLLRAPDGRVKVADFGVAEAADAPNLTRTGLVIGTRSYLAPERALGGPATVRTDLYALGATLLELLTGRKPGGDDPVAALDDVEDLPPDLERLLRRLLDSDPQQRPATAEAALALLAGEVSAPAADGGGHTEVLEPQPDGHRVAADASATTVASTASARQGPAAADTGTAEQPPPSDGHGTPPGAGTRGPLTVSWRTLAAIAVVMLLVAVGFQLVTGGDPPVEAPGVERTDDPADTARNLGEWLRDRAGR